jgi:hypothetical protein
LGIKQSLKPGLGGDGDRGPRELLGSLYGLGGGIFVSNSGEVIIRAATPAASINPLNIVSSFCINN